MAKEKCAKESQRHGDSGKKALIAHFAGGARYVARTLIGKISLAIVRAPNSPFSAVKMGGPFSLRCLSPLCSPAGGVGQTQMAVLGMFRCGLNDFAAQKPDLDGFPDSGGISAQIMLLGMFQCILIFWQRKRPAWVPIHAGLCCEPEGTSPDGSLSYSTDKKTTPDRRAVAPVVPRR